MIPTRRVERKAVVLDTAPRRSIIARGSPVAESVRMDAEPFLITIAEALEEVGLEAAKRPCRSGCPGENRP